MKLKLFKKLIKNENIACDSIIGVLLKLYVPISEPQLGSVHELRHTLGRGGGVVDFVYINK